jgi:erythromycin esterase
MRALLAITTVICLTSLHAAAQGPATREPDDSLQKWLASHAVAIRSIDPNDEDFSDLEPLAAAIGSARVVQLGEPSHGAGSSFAAKARLIKFLHRRLGFDVIAWESGFYDVRLSQRAMRAGENAVSAAQRGILAVWSNAAEARPLFEYVSASQSTARPIDMAGIDLQISAGGTEQAFVAELRAFAARLADAVRRQQIEAGVEQTIAAHTRITSRQNPPTAADFEEFQTTSGELLAAIDRNRAAFDAVHGAREVSFMVRALENVRGRAARASTRQQLEALPEAHRISADWNLRDTLMAENLRWLLDEEYPRRKVIVWAHNAHIMNGYFAPSWGAVHAGMPPNGMMSAGVSVAERLKDGAYTIALTTYEGDEAWANGQRRGPIAPAAPGSFETRLHALAKPYVFLDLRPARRDGHPMRTPQSLRISGYGPPTGPYGNDRVPDLTKALDGVLFIDRMLPATMICQGRCP